MTRTSAVCDKNKLVEMSRRRSGGEGDEKWRRAKHMTSTLVTSFITSPFPIFGDSFAVTSDRYIVSSQISLGCSPAQTQKQQQIINRVTVSFFPYAMVRRRLRPI